MDVTKSVFFVSPLLTNASFCKVHFCSLCMYAYHLLCHKQRDMDVKWLVSKGHMIVLCYFPLICVNVVR